MRPSYKYPTKQSREIYHPLLSINVQNCLLLIREQWWGLHDKYIVYLIRLRYEHVTVFCSFK